MKVKELIAQLLKEDQEATVAKTSDNFELKGAIVDAKGIAIYTHAKKITKGFSDAFDSTSYSNDVWDLLTDDGEETVIRIY